MFTINYKARNEVMLAITIAKIVVFKGLYVKLEDKDGNKEVIMLAKIRERRTRNLDQVNIVKDEDNKVLVKVILIIRMRLQTNFHKFLNEKDQGQTHYVWGFETLIEA